MPTPFTYPTCDCGHELRSYNTDRCDECERAQFECACGADLRGDGSCDRCHSFPADAHADLAERCDAARDATIAHMEASNDNSRPLPPAASARITRLMRVLVWSAA